MLQATFLVIALTVVAAIFFLVVERLPRWLKSLGQSRPFTAIQGLLAPIGLPGWIKYSGFAIWLTLLAILLAGLFLTIGIALWQNLFFDSETPVGLRFSLITITALTGVTGAVIALPFTLRRSIQNERQTRTQEEGYVTQQINEAVANLAAEKEISSIGRSVSISRRDDIPASFLARMKKSIGSINVDASRSLEIFGVRASFEKDKEELAGFLENQRTEIEWRNVELALSEDQLVVDRGDWQVFKRSEPNIEVRIGAILALERLARQRADIAVRDKNPANADNRTPDGTLDHDAARDHVRIMEILCAYIRENAPAESAHLLALTPWPELTHDPSVEDVAAYQETCREQQDLWKLEFENWKSLSRSPRSDIQTALSVLGRRTENQLHCEGEEIKKSRKKLGCTIEFLQWRGYRLDLRHTCLQRADLTHRPSRPMRLNHASLSHAQLHGAIMAGVQLRHATLVGAQLCGANLSRADLRGANLGEALLDLTELSRAGLRGAHVRHVRANSATLSFCQLKAADLRGAKLCGANMHRAELECTDLRKSNLQVANLYRANLIGARLGESLMEGAILRRAQMHRADLWRSQIQGTDLSSTRMQGACLDEVRTDGKTDLKASALKGAALRSVTLRSESVVPGFLTECFGDASVNFEGDWPDGFVPGDPNGALSHWSQKTLNDSEFEKRWRSFQKKIGYPP